LKITPPPGASDRRVRTYTFIDAVQKLRVSFSDDDLDSLYKQIGSKYSGRVKSLFIVIDDDQMRDARSRTISTTSRVTKRGRPGEDPEAPPSQRSK
jgi:hypothetical protein